MNYAFIPLRTNTFLYNLQHSLDSQSHGVGTKHLRALERADELHADYMSIWSDPGLSRVTRNLLSNPQGANMTEFDRLLDTFARSQSYVSARDPIMASGPQLMLEEKPQSIPGRNLFTLKELA